MVFEEAVALQTYGKDNYGQILADVFLPDGTNLIQMLVKVGGAGGIENMRLRRRCWMGERSRSEKDKRAYGLIPIRCNQGSGGIGKSVSKQKLIQYDANWGGYKRDQPGVFVPPTMLGLSS